jgi:hypothetical protein
VHSPKIEIPFPSDTQIKSKHFLSIHGWYSILYDIENFSYSVCVYVFAEIGFHQICHMHKKNRVCY